MLLSLAFRASVVWQPVCNRHGMKRHEKQMSQAEKEVAVSRVRQIAETVISTHAADRMAQKNVTAREIENCLKYGRVIELNNDSPSEYRLVVRHDYGRPKVGVVVVVGVTTGTIVTTWKNAGSDSHATLNLYAYQLAVSALIALAL